MKNLFKIYHIAQGTLENQSKFDSQTKINV